MDLDIEWFRLFIELNTLFSLGVDSMTDAQFEYNGIVSLTASLSETLFAIGAGNRVIGVTDTCDFPEAVKEMPNVSCWFDPDLEALFALKPDLVLGLESAHATIRTAIEREGITVILSNPATVDEWTPALSSRKTPREWSNPGTRSTKTIHAGASTGSVTPWEISSQSAWIGHQLTGAGTLTSQRC